MLYPTRTRAPFGSAHRKRRKRAREKKKSGGGNDQTGLPAFFVGDPPTHRSGGALGKPRKRKEEGEKRGKKGGGTKREKLQHPDFARGHPPHYYLGQNVLNFADRTGCGALTIVWP